MTRPNSDLERLAGQVARKQFPDDKTREYILPYEIKDLEQELILYALKTQADLVKDLHGANVKKRVEAGKRLRVALREEGRDWRERIELENLAIRVGTCMLPVIE